MSILRDESVRSNPNKDTRDTPATLRLPAAPRAAGDFREYPRLFDPAEERPEDDGAAGDPGALPGSWRRWFAGQALSNADLARTSTGGLSGFADLCWSVADAMLRAEAQP